MGGIGKSVARKAGAFGMEIQYTNCSGKAVDVDGVHTGRYVSLDKLLRTSDVISLNLPLDARTQHLLSRQQFKIMKDGVVIVNTSRGKVVDEAALTEALHSGKVYAAGLDVFENEPKDHPELLQSPSVVLLPHVATFTVETRTSMELLVQENLREALTNGQLVTQIKEQLPRSRL